MWHGIQNYLKSTINNYLEKYVEYRYAISVTLH